MAAKKKAPTVPAFRTAPKQSGYSVVKSGVKKGPLFGRAGFAVRKGKKRSTGI